MNGDNNEVPDELRKQLEAADDRILRLLKNVGDPGRCRGCSTDIFWVTHRNGKKAPYTPQGLNHFANCPAAKDFKRSHA